jgi:hypothetical protein
MKGGFLGGHGGGVVLRDARSRSASRESTQRGEGTCRLRVG